jgi:hypothetical protein
MRRWFLPGRSSPYICGRVLSIARRRVRISCGREPRRLARPSIYRVRLWLRRCISRHRHCASENWPGGRGPPAAACRRFAARAGPEEFSARCRHSSTPQPAGRSARPRPAGMPQRWPRACAQRAGSCLKHMILGRARGPGGGESFPWARSYYGYDAWRSDLRRHQRKLSNGCLGGGGGCGK